jgi:hypothetical protein
MTKQYRIHYKVLNGVEVTNDATGEIETKDQLIMTAPMSIGEAETVLASLNLDDEIEDIELREA